MIRTIPNAILIYCNSWEYFVISGAARDAKSPTIRNGRPRPNEYARSNVKARSGFVAARPRIAPRAAPTQGVHPAAKATPKRKDVAYFERFPVTLNLYSFSSQLSRISPVR